MFTPTPADTVQQDCASKVLVQDDMSGPAVHVPGDAIGSYIETCAALESVVWSKIESRSRFLPAVAKNFGSGS